MIENLRVLGSEFSAAELARVRRIPTQNLTAYESVLRGWEHLSRWSESEWLKARQLFERATQLDPHYAKAYAALGHTYTDYDRVLQLARRALELDGSLPEAHHLLAIAYRMKGDKDLALAELDRALDLNPNYAEPYDTKAVLLIQAGQAEEALPLAQTALRLNPAGAASYLFTIGWAYTVMEQHGNALSSLAESLAHDVDHAMTYFLIAFNYGTMWMAQKSDDPQILDKGLKMARKAIALGAITDYVNSI